MNSPVVGKTPLLIAMVVLAVLLNASYSATETSAQSAPGSGGGVIGQSQHYGTIDECMDEGNTLTYCEWLFEWGQWTDTGNISGSGCSRKKEQMRTANSGRTETRLVSYPDEKWGKWEDTGRTRGSGASRQKEQRRTASCSGATETKWVSEPEIWGRWTDTGNTSGSGCSRKKEQRRRSNLGNTETREVSYPDETWGRWTDTGNTRGSGASRQKEQRRTASCSGATETKWVSEPEIWGRWTDTGNTSGSGCSRKKEQRRRSNLGNTETREVSYPDETWGRWTDTGNTRGSGASRQKEQRRTASCSGATETQWVPDPVSPPPPRVTGTLGGPGLIGLRDSVIVTADVSPSDEAVDFVVEDKVKGTNVLSRSTCRGGIQGTQDDGLRPSQIRVWGCNEGTGIVHLKHSGSTLASHEITVRARKVKFDASSYSVTEGSSVTVTVEMDPPARSSLTILIAVGRGTAEVGDYSLSSGSLTFGNGATSTSFTVTAVGDSDSDDETIRLSFRNLPDHVTAGSPSSATLTIKEPVERVVTFRSSSYSVTEGSSVTVTIDMSPAADREYIIPITGAGASVTFGSGERSRTFPYSPGQDDNCDNASATLGFGSLPSGVSAGSTPTTTVAVTDDETCTVSFGSSSYSVTEGSDETITVRISPTSSLAYAIPITVTRGSAESSDYTVSGLSNGKLTFSGQGAFTIETNRDSDTSNETVNIRFGTLPAGVSAGSPSRATLTILDSTDPPPPPPGQVSPPSVRAGDRSLTVSWSAPAAGSSSITSYRVQHKLSSASWPSTYDSVGAATTQTAITGLTNGSTYDVRVRACNSGGCGSWSLSRSGTPLPAPPAPTGLTAAAAGPTSVSLSWSTASGGISKHRVRRGPTASGPWTTVSSNVSGTTYAVTGLQPSTTYHFQVGAHGDGSAYRATWSSWSSSASAATDRVAPPQQPPTFDDGATTTRSVAENATTGSNIGSPVRASDPNGDMLAYSLSGADSSSFAIDGAKGQLRTSAALDYEAENSYTVIVYVSDGKNASGDSDSSNDDSIVVTVTITNVEEPGSVALSPNVVNVGTEITAELTDPDGDVTNESWQWQRLDGGTWSNISGATTSGAATSTYTTVNADVDKSVRATVSYDDGHGTGKTATSTQASVLQASFPLLSSPHVSVFGPDRKSVSVSYSLPSDTRFDYELALLRSVYGRFDDERYFSVAGVVVNPKKAPYEFMGTPTATTTSEAGYYKAALRACTRPPGEVRCVPYMMSASTLTKLAPPTNLDVRPMQLRRARLSWTQGSVTTPDTVYRVYAEDPNLNTIATSTLSRFDTARTLDLDKIFGGWGLDDFDYFKLWVVATTTAQSSTVLTSEASETIRIVDNPIASADGHPGPNVHVKWATSTVTRVGTPTATAMTVDVRYRQLGDSAQRKDHTTEEWRLDGVSYPPTFDDTWRDGSPTDGLITLPAFNLGEVYALQLNYEDADGWVYSARDAFVWPSAGFPPDGERVAGYPFFGHWKDGEYDYTVCEDTFLPANKRTDWTELIEHAFEQWETAVPDLLTVTRTSGGCTVGDHPISNDNPITVVTALYNETNEVYMVDVARWGSETDIISISLRNLFILCIVRPACVISTRYREVATPAGQALDPGSVDVLVNVRRAPDPSKQDDPNRLDIPVTVRFNQCLGGGRSRNYELMVHEAGHALGLSGLDATVPWTIFDDANAHPSITDSVMSYDSVAGEIYPEGSAARLKASLEPECSPYPLDILAIRALYQASNQ